MSLAETIKRLSAGQNEASAPVAILFGQVTQTNPLEVFVDQRFTLPADFLILTERLSRYTINFPGSGEVVIREGLKTGDGVLLVRMQGGSRYVILDKVVDS